MHGARVSVDLSSWSAIRDSGEEAFRDAVRAIAPDVVFANEDEERLVGRSLVDAVWILKRGARGCSFDGDEREAVQVDGGRLDRGRRRARGRLDRRRA